MREITNHKVGSLNNVLRIRALDEPGPGGACAEYVITGLQRPPGLRQDGIKFDGPPPVHCDIRFQRGLPMVEGVNGITNEALLAILIDRFVGFQQGPFASDVNAKVLMYLDDALALIQYRTRERAERGVEGTYEK